MLRKQGNKKFRLKISFIEIYDNKVYDLLSPSTSVISMIEDPVKGLLFPGIHETEMHSISVGINELIKGNSKRLSASTENNDKSSSSHAVITLICEHLSKSG